MPSKRSTARLVVTAAFGAVVAGLAAVTIAAQAALPSGTITGRVVDRVGVVPSWAVILRSADLSIRPAILRTTRTDRVGRFAFENLPEGRFTLTVPPVQSMNGVRRVGIEVVTGRPVDVTLTVTIGVVCECITFTGLADPDVLAMATGHVTDSDGVPLPFARVRVGQATGHADVNGFFQIVSRPGFQAISVDFLGFEPVTRPIVLAPGTETLDDVQLGIARGDVRATEERLGGEGCRCGSPYGAPYFQKDGLLFTPIVMPKGRR